MELIRTPEDIASLKENTVIGGEGLTMNKSSITFRGTGNIFVAEDGVTLQDTNITFGGDNAVVYLSKSRNPYRLALSAHRETTVFIGRDGYFNGRLNAVLSERQSLIIGNDALLSFGIWMRTADPHLLYDADTKERINPSKSIYIGDHVWLGQDVMLLKGAEIGSGAVISARALVANKRIPSNTVWGGDPARLIRKNVFFTGDCVHNWDAAQTAASKVKNTNRFIFEDDGIARKSFEKIDIALKSQVTAEARLKQIRLLLVDTSEDKNRFYIPLSPEVSDAAVSGTGRKKKLFGR